MATFEQRKNSDGTTTYRVKVRLKGHPVETASFERKTDAKRWAAETETAIRAGRYFKAAEAKRHTMKEAIDRYLRDVMPSKSEGTRHSQTLQLDWWKERLGTLTIADITPALIVEARDFLMSAETRNHTKRKEATIVRYLAALSHVFTTAIKEWQWCEDNPVQRVTKPKEPRGRVRHLSDEERAKLLNECKESRNDCLYDIVVLAISTGMRRNEILSLKWEDVDLNRGIVVLQETKNGDRRGVPLVGHALELLKERARLRRLDTSLIFPAPYRHGRVTRPVDIQSAWDLAVKRAGFPADADAPKHLRFHDLRHTAASYLLMNGASTGELAEILGHRTLQMVRRYSHISLTHATTIVERMNRAVFEAAAQDETGHDARS